MSEETDRRTPEEIEADLARTRGELGDTVTSLVAKTDVETRGKQWVHDAKDRATDKTRAATDKKGRGLALGAAAAAAVAFLGVAWRARSR